MSRIEGELPLIEIHQFYPISLEENEIEGLDRVIQELSLNIQLGVVKTVLPIGNEKVDPQNLNLEKHTIEKKVEEESKAEEAPEVKEKEEGEKKPEETDSKISKTSSKTLASTNFRRPLQKQQTSRLPLEVLSQMQKGDDLYSYAQEIQEVVKRHIQDAIEQERSDKKDAIKSDREHEEQQRKIVKDDLKRFETNKDAMEFSEEDFEFDKLGIYYKSFDTYHEVATVKLPNQEVGKKIWQVLKKGKDSLYLNVGVDQHELFIQPKK